MFSFYMGYKRDPRKKETFHFSKLNESALSSGSWPVTSADKLSRLYRISKQRSGSDTGPSDIIKSDQNVFRQIGHYLVLVIVQLLQRVLHCRYMKTSTSSAQV